MKDSNEKNYYIPVIIAVIIADWLTKNMNFYLSLIVGVLIALSVGYLYKIISEFIENKKHKK